MNLDANDYWRLRAVNSDLERDQATLAVVQGRIEASKAKREAVWKEVVEKYGLDMNGQYSAKDEDCSINPVS